MLNIAKDYRDDMSPLLSELDMKAPPSCIAMELIEMKQIFC